jgi:hypothetical protein
MFLQVAGQEDRVVAWRLAIHGMFLAGAVLLGVVDRIGRHGSAARNETV